MESVAAGVYSRQAGFSGISTVKDRELKEDLPLLTRRVFLQATLVTAGAVLTGARARDVFAQAPADAEIRFVMLSDTHVGSQGDAARLERAIPWIRRENPAFLLHGGDVVERLVTDRKEVEAARSLLARLPAPLHLVPGNHDLGLSDSRELRQLWKSSFGPTEQIVRHGEWTFVGFDSLALADSCRCGPLEEEVFHFLETELPRLDGRRTILFYHVPEVPRPFSDSIGWTDTALERWRAFSARLGPAAALTGHWHVGVKLSVSPHPLIVAPPISGRGNLPTGYLRCSIKGDMLLCERVMIETLNKRDLPGLVRGLLLPEGKAPT
jgi:hypothetical protein